MVTKAVDEVSALLRIVVSQILKFIFFLVQMVGVAHDARYRTPIKMGAKAFFVCALPLT